MADAGLRGLCAALSCGFANQEAGWLEGAAPVTYAGTTLYVPDPNTNWFRASNFKSLSKHGGAGFWQRYKLVTTPGFGFH